MSNLDNSINALERELAVKKGYQAVKFVLPKTLPEDVATEIQAKLREVADTLALTQDALTPATLTVGNFTEDEISVIKLLINAVKNKAVDTTPAVQASAAPQAVNGRVPASPGGATVHQPKNYGAPRKAKILTAENVRGEGKRFTAPDDDLHVPNPEKVDDHGMITATLMKKGMIIKIPVDDVTWVE